MEVPTAVWPVLLFVVLASATAAVLLLISAVANPARTNPVKQMPYESGMDPIHDTRRPFDVRFHLLAIAFLVFDVELLFLYPWAVATQPAAARSAQARAVSNSEADVVAGAASASASEMQAPAASTPQLATGRSGRPADSPEPAPGARAVGIAAAVAAEAIPSRDYAFWGAMLFIALLALGLVYDWRKGILLWR